MSAKKDGKGITIGGLVVGGVQTALGAGVMAVGVPLLVLPGPGLLVLGGGAVLTAGGVKRMLGR